MDYTGDDVFIDWMFDAFQPRLSKAQSCVSQCRFMCSDRWSDRENERWHRWQRNGFCPVCFRKWRVSSSDRANFQVQPSHVHWYGFSPARPKRQKKDKKQNTNKMNIIGYFSKKTNKIHRHWTVQSKKTVTYLCVFVCEL